MARAEMTMYIQKVTIHLRVREVHDGQALGMTLADKAIASALSSLHVDPAKPSEVVLVAVATSENDLPRVSAELVERVLRRFQEHRARLASEIQPKTA